MKTEVKIFRALADGVAELDRRPIYEWAAEFIENPGAWTQSGKFNPDFSNHFKGPFDALQNPSLKRVTVRKPIRGGGSLISDIWLAWTVANCSAPSMWVMQSAPVADAHALTRLIPIIEACKPAARLLPSDARKLTKGGVLLKNGMPIYFQGSALGRLQSKGIRWLSLDEVWEWDAGLVRQALGRTGDFDLLENSKQLLTSQGGTENTEWESLDSASSQNEWMVPCLECGKFNKPVFGGQHEKGNRYGMVWDSNDKTKYADGQHNFGEIIPSIRWVCEFCGHAHTDRRRTQAEWNRRGRYEPQNPHPVPGVAGYHWHGMIFKNWSDMVIDFLQAQEALKKGVVEPLKLFVQKQEANHWSDSMQFKTEKIELSDYKSDWPDEKFRFMTVDKMAEVLWFVIRAWALDGRSRRLAFGKVGTKEEIMELQKRFHIKNSCTFWDSGWDATEVYRICADNFWFALKGSDEQSFPHPVKQKNGKVIFIQKTYSAMKYMDASINRLQPGRKNCPLIRWSNPAIKPITKNLRDGKGAEWLLGKGQGINATDAEYNEQMHSEWLKTKTDKAGFPVRRWEPVAGKQNHAWDCENMQTFAANFNHILEINPLPTLPAQEPSVDPKSPEQPETSQP